MGNHFSSTLLWKGQLEVGRKPPQDRAGLWGHRTRVCPHPPETGPASPDSWPVAVGPWAMASGCPRATSPYHPRSPRQPCDIALVVNLQLVTGVWGLGRSSESPTSSPPGGTQTRAGSLEPKAGEGGRTVDTDRGEEISSTVVQHQMPDEVYGCRSVWGGRWQVLVCVLERSAGWLLG